MHNKKINTENKNEEDAFLRHFFENNPIAIARLDEKCNVVNANQVARLLFVSIGIKVKNPFLEDLESMIISSFSGDISVFDREITINNKIYEQTIFRIEPHFLYSYIIDITKRKQYENKLEEMTHYDMLTGLANRHALLEHLQYSLLRTSRHTIKLGLLYIDLDEFKKVNDTYGHEIGNFLLIEVGKRLKSVLRKGDFIARIGGDEFVTVLEDLHHSLNAANIANIIISALKKPFFISQHEFFITCSIGIAIYYPGCEDTIEQLMQHADMAMYKAKKNGREQYQFYNNEMNLKAKRFTMIENRLHHAIDHQELHLNYQILYNARTSSPVSMEVLLRWQDSKLGNISPEEFIPIAESSGLMVDVGNWVIESAFQEYMKFFYSKNLTIGINFSVKQFDDMDFYNSLTQLISKYKIPPERLIIEITETMLMKNPGDIKKILDKLVFLGIKIAVDDFGTGYASFLYLQQFPIHILKIDKSFIQGIFSQSSSLSIVKISILLAHELGLEVIAEGVETKEQFEWLKKEGCDVIQGYYFSKPCLSKDVKI